ncbi:MAG: hypothetical protein HY799_02240 [Nitrosomonadales bacterium]|nr:hypothetical protein [Nitrosomonadales bacterium]
MSSAMLVMLYGFGMLLLFGFGVFAMCLHAGESIMSAAAEASGWWVAFSVSYFFGHLAIMFG